MKPAITHRDLYTYRTEDIEARTHGRDRRDILADLPAEAVQHTENTTHWLTVFRTDGASTDPFGPHEGLGDDDRGLLLGGDHGRDLQREHPGRHRLRTAVHRTPTRLGSPDHDTVLTAPL